MNDLRGHKIKYVSNVESANINYNIGDSLKIKINRDTVVESSISLNKDFQFKVGMKIKHKEEGICGEIKFIGQEKIAIVWEDNTRERMNLSEAQNTLDYVDDIQTLVSPLQTESKEDKQVEINPIVEKALSALNSDELDDELIEKIDVEKVKMQREINDLQNQLTNKKTNSMKEKIAKDIIDMAIMKSIIDEDDRDLEMVKVLSFNDEEFEEYKTSILDYQTDGNIVTSSFAPQPVNMTEAEKMLNKIKNNGGKGIIGDFSKELNPTIKTAQAVNTIENNVSSSTEKRTLSDIKDEKYTFATRDSLPPSFEEAFGQILSEKVEINGSNKKSISANMEKDLSGFENIQGLKAPIRITEASASFPTNTSMKDLISSLDWTILPGKK